ncbi:MAG: hypothetical protein AB8I08_39705, partial [Sandaracinaceae bacterium]
MRASISLLVLLTACGPSAPDDTAPSDSESASAGSEAPPDRTETEASDTLPASVSPGQGEQAVGVYLATIEDAAQATAWMDRLRERGVENAGSAELSCDRGAAEAL